MIRSVRLPAVSLLNRLLRKKKNQKTWCLPRWSLHLVSACVQRCMGQVWESQSILPRETDISVAGNYWLLNYWCVFRSQGLRDGCGTTLNMKDRDTSCENFSSLHYNLHLFFVCLIFSSHDELAKWTWNYKNLDYLLVQGSRMGELMRVSVCHGIHCQVSDRFLFVHKLRSLISSIFETIKQRRENGWLGNPWILICQQNENESGRWWKCAEWEVAADVGKEQTFILFFFPFCTQPLSFTALPGGQNESDLLPEVWNCCKSEWNRQREATCVSCASFKYESRRKIHGLQSDSVMIAPPGTGCFPVSRHQAFLLNCAHKVFTWKSKHPAPGAEMPKAWKMF